MKRNIIYIVVGIIVAVLMGIFFYHGEEKSTPPSHVTDNGAEIEVPEGAVGFGCSCGCQDEGGDGVCRCENCDMHETKEEVEEPEVIYFENPDENDEAVFVLPQERSVDARHAGLDGERAVRIDVHDLSCDLLLDHVMRPRVSRARLRGSSRGARLRMPSYRSRSICVPWPRRSAALPCRSRPCVSSLH